MTKALLTTCALFVLAACGPSQPPECAKYLECQAAVDAETGDNMGAGQEEAYGPEGTCWSGNETSADVCTQSCVALTNDMNELFPDVEECQ